MFAQMINIEVLQKIQSRGFALRDGFRNVSSVGGINQFVKKKCEILKEMVAIGI